MNDTDPSRAPSPLLIVPGDGVANTYEEDLLNFLHDLSLDEIVDIQTNFTYRTRAGDPLSDHDIALNYLLQQARWLAVFNQDRTLAQRISDGEDPVVEERPSRRPHGAPQPKNIRNGDPTGHDCVVCQSPIHGAEIRAPCGHYYGIDCLTDLFQLATRDESLFPPRCCRRNIALKQAQTHLPPDLVTTFQQKQVEFSTLQRVYCSSRACSRFLGPLSEDTDKVYTCPAPECGMETCARCRGSYNIEWTHDCRLDPGFTQVLDLARTTGWARCPGCSQMIERRMGCNHITCRCRTEFCYLCTTRWKECHCPLYGV